MDKFFSIIRGLGLKRGPERWLGGVRISSDRPGWRWDEQAAAPVLVR